MGKSESITEEPASGKKGSGAEDKETDEAADAKTVRSTSFIIQKYMEAPLLIAERKFDIRVWVLASNF